MNDLNKVVIVGRLTKDCGADQDSFKYLQNGTCVAKVSIATNRSVKRGDQWVEDVSYFDVTIWGKTAENLKPYLTRGKQIAVDGFLKQERWQDQQTGAQRSRITVIAENVQLLGGKDNSQPQQNNNEQNYGGFRPRPQPQYETQQYSQPQQTAVPQQNNLQFGGTQYEEDIPF